MLAGVRSSMSLLQVFLCFILLFICSCGQEEIYEGVYKVEGEKSWRRCHNQIELMEKGMGVWRLLGDEVSFRWDVKDSEIWLRTKLGGIIIGKIQGEIIEITLPGSKTMSFRKAI